LALHLKIVVITRLDVVALAEEVGGLLLNLGQAFQAGGLDVNAAQPKWP